jgi:hypothetical protein
MWGESGMKKEKAGGLIGRAVSTETELIDNLADEAGSEKKMQLCACSVIRKVLFLYSTDYLNLSCSLGRLR